MKIVVVMVWLFWFLLPGLSSGQNSHSSKLLIALVKDGYWTPVTGALPFHCYSSAFVLYEEGLVIFHPRSNSNDRSYGSASVLLESAEREKFLATLQIGKAFDELSGGYRLTDAKDLNTSSLFIGQQGRVKRISLYGDEVPPYYSQIVKTGELAPVPSVLLELLTKIHAFDHKRAQPWHPDNVTILAEPERVNPKWAIPWPMGWPSFRHSTTMRQSLFLDLDYMRFSNLVEILKQRGDHRKSAFSIKGTTYSLSCQYPFPSEAAWR